MSDQSVQTKSTPKIACIVHLEGQRGDIQGGFFWWSSRFSVPKWKKTRCRQQELIVEKIQCKRTPSWLSRSFILVLKNGATVKCADKKYTDRMYCWSRFWKVEEGKYVSSVYLLAWQTEIIANPIQPGFVAESGFIVPPWMPRPCTLLALLSEQKRNLSLWLLMGGYQNLNQLQEVDTANAGVKMWG